MHFSSDDLQCTYPHKIIWSKHIFIFANYSLFFILSFVCLFVCFSEILASFWPILKKNKSTHGVRGIFFGLVRNFSLLGPSCLWQVQDETSHLRPFSFIISSMMKTPAQSQAQGIPLAAAIGPLLSQDCLGCLFSFSQHAIQSIFVGRLDYTPFLFNASAFSDYKNKLVAYLGTNIWNLAW